MKSKLFFGSTPFLISLNGKFRVKFEIYFWVDLSFFWNGKVQNRVSLFKYSNIRIICSKVGIRNSNILLRIFQYLVNLVIFTSFHYIILESLHSGVAEWLKHSLHCSPLKELIVMDVILVSNKSLIKQNKGPKWGWGMQIFSSKTLKISTST